MENNNQKPSLIQEKKYDIIFVGGGPATLSFLSYLFKNKQEHLFSSYNILIVEKSETFGSGCLGKYGINSNTSGEGFLRILSFPDEKIDNKSNLSPSKKTLMDCKKDTKLIVSKQEKNEPNKNKLTPLPIFTEFFQYSPSQTLFSFGSKPAPLPLIGYFFDCFGNIIVDYIYKTYNKNILLSRTEVLSLKIANNDEFIINAKQNDVSYLLRSKIVVLANGARTFMHPKYLKDLNKVIKSGDFFTSDNILQEQGYMKMISNLKGKKEKKVVIIGGSHSGFSAAWILLNGPSKFSIIGKEWKYKKGSCMSCSSCNFNCYAESQNTVVTDNKNLINNNAIPNKNCSNQCYGKVFDKFWKSESHEAARTFLKDREKLDISIIYRENIRVYYPTEEEAFYDGYKDFDKSKAINKSGNVYPFIGIRGDSKELYRSIVKGREKRVKLIRCDNWDNYKNYINTGSIVIWACGYETQNITVYDNRNHLIEFNNNEEKKMFEVNKELQILDKNKIPIKNLYGIGQGYSTFSSEIVNGIKARADAVNLYNTHIAKKLFRSIENHLNKINDIRYNEIKKIPSTESKLYDSKSKRNNSLKQPTNDNTLNTPLAKNTLLKNQIEEQNKKSMSNMKNYINSSTPYNHFKNSYNNSFQVAGSQHVKERNKLLNKNNTSLQNVSISSNINKVVATSVISLKSNNNTTEFFQQISPTKVDSSAMTNNLIKSQNVENKNSNFYSSYFKHLYGNNNDKRINYEKPYEKPDKQKFSYHINESKKVEGKFPFLPKKSSNHNLGNTLSGNNRYNNIRDEIRKSEEVNYFLTPTFNKNSSKSQIGSSQYSISNMANSHKFDRSDFTKIY